jgi:hypothetical protein
MSQQESKSLFWYRVKFLGLIVVFLSPFIGGWLALYVFEVRPASGNYGTLIQPIKKLNWPILETMDGEMLESGFGRKWTFLLFAGASCDELCRNNLFYMRQVRTLLGRDTMRLQNVLITAQPLDEKMKIYLQNFPNLKVIVKNRDPALYEQFYLQELGEVGSSPRIYLVDPDQNLMMYFPAENDQAQVLKDIKKLMKLSQIG